MFVCDGVFPSLILYSVVCLNRWPTARQTSLNHAAKWKPIYSWMDLSEMPKVYKNNGVCNIIPGDPNGSSLKGGKSSIRRLHSSVRSRECRGKRVRCERLPASRDLQPSLEHYKALPHYYSPLHISLPSAAWVRVHFCACVFMCGIKWCFSSPPSELMLTRLPRFACIRILCAPANRRARVLIS